MELTDAQLAGLFAGGDEASVQQKAQAMAAALRGQQQQAQQQSFMGSLGSVFRNPSADVVGRSFADQGKQDYERAGQMLEQIPKAAQFRLAKALEQQRMQQQGQQQAAEMGQRQTEHVDNVKLKRQQLAQGKFGVISPGGQVFNQETGELGAVGDVTKPGPASASPIKGEASLRKELNSLSEVKEFKTVKDAYGKVQAAATGDFSSPQADMSLIFAYMKMLDPGSTVREGEYASAQNTTGAAGKLTNLYNRSLSGNFLNATQRKGFAAEAAKVFGVHQSAYGKAATHYRGLAEKAGFDPSSVVLDLDEKPAGGSDRAAKKAAIQKELDEIRARNPSGAAVLP